MKITYKKGKGDKIHISADGEYVATVDEVFFYSLGVRENQEMSPCELNETIMRIGERRAYNYAVSLLSRREHTIKEIADKLKLKGYGQYADGVCEKLCNQGFLDDERFAQMFTRELVSLKGYGKRRVEQELIRKGVAREIIREVIYASEFPEGRIIEIINKKYSRYLDTEKGVQKTVNGLMRLGYSYGEIREALNEIADRSDEFYEVTDE